jgi:host factor-I protein
LAIHASNPQAQRAVLWSFKSVPTGDAMKDGIESSVADQPLQPEGFANRKLIRPSLSRSEHSHMPALMGERRDRPERVERNGHGERSNGAGKKPSPPEQTNAENFYYQKQMQSKTPMVIVLRDGEEIRGTIEWYDKSCLKLNRNGAANLMVYKPSIKYMYKEGENCR